MARRASYGFTLIELLVAMALMAIVMAGLLSALRAFGATEVRIDTRIRDVDERRVSVQFLREILGTVSIKLEPPSAGGVRRIVFYGTADEIRWVGFMPARHGAGGLYHFRLMVDRSDRVTGGRLMLQFAPYAGIEPPSDWGQADGRPLTEHVDELRVEYLDEEPQPPEWFGQWILRDRLPGRIRLAVTVRGQPWADLVVRVYPVAADSDAAATRARGGGAVIGPF